MVPAPSITSLVNPLSQTEGAIGTGRRVSCLQGFCIIHHNRSSSRCSAGYNGAFVAIFCDILEDNKLAMTDLVLDAWLGMLEEYLRSTVDNI
ncbi:hypothetical protein SLE2022_103490 [Rubroshorea leprosula]